MSDKPLIMFHGRSAVYGRPNSVESITGALKHSVDIIELDVRKSSDGVLYCYHGSWFARLLKYFSFGFIKNNLKIDTLEEVLKIITTKKIIFLDIKDKRITAADLKKVCDKFDQEYWVAGYDLLYLGQLKSILKNYKFVYNFAFLNLQKGLEKAKENGVGITKVFRWQLTSNLKPILLQLGIEFTIYPPFMSTQVYLKNVQKYGSIWMAYDDLGYLNKPFIGF